MSAPAKDTAAAWNERDMKDRAYRVTKGKTQHIYLYLIDRCEKRPGQRTPQGFVMNGFYADTSIASITGEHHRDVEKALVQLVAGGDIRQTCTLGGGRP